MSENNVTQEIRLQQIGNEVYRLKKQNRLMKYGIILCVAFTLFSSFYEPERKIDFLRVKQLIVEDEKGKDRIILAADFAKTKDRLRRDTLGGMLILNEKGYDQILIGHSRTVQFNGQKMYRIHQEKPYGFFVNDSIGDERGGFSYFNKRKLSIMGLDNKNGEGVHMLSSDKGLYDMRSGVFVQTKNESRSLFLGENKDNNILLSLRNVNYNVAFFNDSIKAGINAEDVKNKLVKPLLTIGSPNNK